MTDLDRIKQIASMLPHMPPGELQRGAGDIVRYAEKMAEDALAAIHEEDHP